jgi:hypothetical protein
LILGSNLEHLTWPISVTMVSKFMVLICTPKEVKACS